MKKFFAGSGVAVLVSLGIWGTSAPAQAYPNDTPAGGTTPSSDVLGSGAPSSGAASAGVLPNTGGPETPLLIGGVALLVVGGVAVATTKRRHADA
ncbi:LPXTG cell wall anchor domain-containing protein [Nocardioides aurantiacus]|uniref:LPXTG cell wall anchor domain-containing protein n=1 Tax=Nocardioides aurantiacus TaxID=86796 RepID=UPI00403FB18E